MITTPPKSDLNDLMLFAAVVHYGSITAAAEKLSTAKANVSRKLSKLEQTLGVRLLERSTRRQHLTEIGHVYYQHCLRIKSELESADACVNRLLQAPRGTLKICASVSVGQGLLAPLWADFSQSYPEINLDIQLTNRRVDIIEEGFDLVIRVGKLEDSNLIAKLLMRSQLLLCASPSYEKQYGLPTHPEQLFEHQCLYMSATPGPVQWHFHQAAERSQIALLPKFKINDFNSIKQSVIQGAGIAALPHYLAQPYIDTKQIIPVLSDWSLPAVDIFAIYPSYRGATPKLRALLDFFSSRLSSFTPRA